MRHATLVLTLLIATGPCALFRGSVLAQVDQLSEARQLLIEAGTLIKDVPEFQQGSAVANVSSQLARAGDLTEALAVVRLLKQEEQGLAIGCIAWQLAKSGNAAQARSLIEGTKGPSTNSSFQQLAQLLVQKGDFEQGLGIAHLIIEPQPLADTLVRLAVLRAKDGDRAGASRALDAALDVANDATTKDFRNATIFGEIASAQAEIGETPETSFALGRLYAIAYQRKVGSGDTSLLQDLAATEARIGNISDATDIVGELSEGSADYVLILISQEVARKRSMTEALEVASNISALSTRDSALREIAMIRGRAGHSDDSLEAIDMMTNPSSRAEAVGVLALEQAEAEDPGAYTTLQLWEGATGGGIADGGRAREFAAVTYGLLGDFVSAERILSSIQEPEVRVWPLWNLTSFLVNKGHAQEAFDIAYQEEAAYPRVYALLGTASGILDQLESEGKAKSNRH